MGNPNKRISQKWVPYIFYVWWLVLGIRAAAYIVTNTASSLVYHQSLTTFLAARVSVASSCCLLTISTERTVMLMWTLLTGSLLLFCNANIFKRFGAGSGV